MWLSITAFIHMNLLQGPSKKFTAYHQSNIYGIGKEEGEEGVDEKSHAGENRGELHGFGYIEFMREE